MLEPPLAAPASTLRRDETYQPPKPKSRTRAGTPRTQETKSHARTGKPRDQKLKTPRENRKLSTAETPT
jgi:hypothetical protein